MKRVYKAPSLNIAIQDGEAAGQSVPHVHAHLIPRHDKDMDDRGGKDKIYELMEGEEGDIGAHQAQANRRAKSDEEKASFAKPDADRAPRSAEEMQKEAEWLAKEMERDGEQ